MSMMPHPETPKGFQLPNGLLCRRSRVSRQQVLHVLVQSDDSFVDPKADDLCTDAALRGSRRGERADFFILSTEAHKAQHS
jgi:hypothetical protein